MCRIHKYSKEQEGRGKVEEKRGREAVTPSARGDGRKREGNRPQIRRKREGERGERDTRELQEYKVREEWKGEGKL